MRLITGDIVFLADIPDQVDGYVQDPKQKALFKQQKPPCKLRSLRKCNCSNPIKLEQCDLGLPLDCLECKERVE